MVTIRKCVSEVYLLQVSFREKPTSLNTVFVNPIKFRRVLAAMRNHVIHYSIVFLLVIRQLREINENFM